MKHVKSSDRAQVDDVYDIGKSNSFNQRSGSHFLKSKKDRDERRRKPTSKTATFIIKLETERGEIV